MALALPVLAAAALLVLTPGGLFYYDVTPKVAVVGLGSAAMLLYGLRRLPHLLARRDGAWFAGLLGLQCVSVAVATLLAANPALSLSGSNWRRYGLITQTAVLLFALLSAAVLAEQPRRLTKWLAIFTAGGLAASTYICLQYFGVDPLLPAEAYRIGEGEWAIVRPPGTLGHAGYAATFALHSVFAGLALVVAGEEPALRRLGWAGATAGSAAILLSGTRGAMLGLAVGIAALLYLVRPPAGSVRKWIKPTAIAAAAVILCGGFYVSPMGQALRSRVRWSSEDPLGGARLRLWRDSLRMGASRWATGWGPEAFPAEFPRYQSEDLARAYPDFYHESPHNILIGAWTSQGLPGVILLAGFLALGVRAARRNRVSSALAAGLAAAVAAQMFLSFTAMTALCFYFTLAMLVAAAPADRETPPMPSRAYAWVYACAAPAALATVVYSVMLIGAGRELRIAESEIAQGRLTDAAAAYERARDWQPPGASSDLWFSRALMEAARRAPFGAEQASSVVIAVEAAERATSNSEDPHNAFYNRAQLAAVQSDVAAIESNLRAAIEASPTWFKPHWTLAELLLLTGRRDEARAEAALAVDLDGHKHAEVLATLDKVAAAQ